MAELGQYCLQGYDVSDCLSVSSVDPDQITLRIHDGSYGFIMFANYNKPTFLWNSPDQSRPYIFQTAWLRVRRRVTLTRIQAVCFTKFDAKHKVKTSSRRQFQQPTIIAA